MNTKHCFVNFRTFVQLAIILCWAHFNGFNDLHLHEIYCTAILARDLKLVQLEIRERYFWKNLRHGSCVMLDSPQYMDQEIPQNLGQK